MAGQAIQVFLASQASVVYQVLAVYQRILVIVVFQASAAFPAGLDILAIQAFQVIVV